MHQKFAHFLLADDDPDDVELFEYALGEVCPWVQLSVAKDGVELIGMLDKIPTPNIIVLDLNMPLLSGKECLVKIRKMPRFDNVPVVILSTSHHKRDVDFCLTNGANNYLVKPPSFEHMKSLAEMMCAEATES